KLIIVELGNERAQNLGRAQTPVRPREIGPVAPILGVAEEEDLNAGVAAFLGDGEDVGLLDAAWVDALMSLDVRQSPEPVAVVRGPLEFELLRSFVHQLVQLFLNGI